MATGADDIDGLVDRLRQGDHQALAEIFANYRDPLRRMVAFRLDHRLNGRVSPSDILQEAYLDAANRLHHYLAKPGQSVFGWLRLIVGQRLIDVHRQHRGAQGRDAGREVALDRDFTSADSSACLAAHLVGNLTSPSEAVMRHEAFAQLEAALNQMDAMDREVLVLRHFEELSNQEVAEVLELTKAAASKRYVRALARLKDILAQIPGLGEVLS
jgi:RNA polymerase sigma-70 factor (ECF subfamily)